MKKSAIFLVMILVLPLFLQSPTYAAIQEFNNPIIFTGENNSIKNGGKFWDANNSYTDPVTGVTTIMFDWSWDKYNGSNTSSLTTPSEVNESFSQYDIGGYYTNVSFTGTAATSSSSSSSDNSISASAYASMTYEGFTDATNTPGVDVKQTVQARYVQTYCDPDATTGQLVQISGLLNLPLMVDLDGNPLFDILNSDIYSSYSISGGITVNEYTQGSSSNSLIASVTLNDGKLSGSDTFVFLPGDYTNVFGGSGSYYTVTAVLTINTELKNVDETAKTTASLNGAEFIIGDMSDPVTLTTLLEPAAVPVPSTLLLLISGIAGISFIGRRQS